MLIECPYCEKDFELDDSNLEYLNSENIITDIECPHCEEMTDVHVDFEPIPSPMKIEYCKCDDCGKKLKKREGKSSGKVFPFPKNKTFLCKKCYWKEIEKEFDKNFKNP